MFARLRPTVRRVFGFAFLGLLLGLTLLFYLVLQGSQQTILQSAERYRDLASRDVAHRVTGYLDEAPMAVTHFQQQVHYGLIRPGSIASIESGLLSLLIANENLSEATLTYADNRSFGPGKHAKPDPNLAGQVAMLRTMKDGQFVRRLTWFDGRDFVSESAVIAPDGTIKPTDTHPMPAMDPTEHLTFKTPATDPDAYGRVIPTDLHWSQIDEALPERERRVEVSALKTIDDRQGNFVGVLRIGLMKSQIDGAVQQHITRPHEGDPHLIFICDRDGRLITGFSNRDDVTVSGDDLRIAPKEIPPVVARALQEPALKNVDENESASSLFHFNGKVYLCTFLSLPGTLDWVVGIVVPREFYLGPLVRTREMVLAVSLALIATIAFAGGFIIRGVVQAQSQILRETKRMNAFEFSPADPRSFLQDINEILLSLEKGKTALRAMSKYVPINLVRRLYHEGQEPELGAQSAELSVLFTDIKGFTSFAETSSPDEVARLLGLYLEVMATTIQGEQGTIDKYIGDAVMAFWNAPERVANHEFLACRAALRCQAALQKLYSSLAWGDAPHFETRFGLHRCTASVGHFGAPDRFNYTAIGDGINLASRLEGLNKHYGTTIIASESIRSMAGTQFEFRLLDRVVVKGKTAGLMIYELIAAGSQAVRTDRVERYEHSFALYQRADFKGALALLDQQSDDPPSVVLSGRCQDFIAHPPPDSWDGVHAFDVK
jgi:adenylate cyclase